MFIVGLKYDCCANEFEMSSIILLGLTNQTTTGPNRLIQISYFNFSK
jgi:hypothetical protein